MMDKLADSQAKLVSLDRPENRSCRVLLVDDHRLILEVICVALSDGFGPGTFVSETAYTVDAALQMIDLGGHYDVVLLDYQIPGSTGLDGLTKLISANNGKVVLFSGIATKEVVDQAMKLGASGYIPKTIPLRTLRNAIQFVAAGEVFLPIDFLQDKVEPKARALGLKPGEMRVLRLLCQGYPNKKIYDELNLQPATVKVALRSICRKLGVRNRTEAVIEAQKHGLV